MILLMHHFVKMTCLHGAVVQSIVTGTYLMGMRKKLNPIYGIVTPCHHKIKIFVK